MSLHCGHSASDKLLHQSLLVCQGLMQGNSCDGRSAADRRWQSNMQHLEREAAEWNRSRGRRATVLSDCCFSFLCTSERDIRRLHVFAARNTKPTAFSSTGNGINVKRCVVSKLTEQINAYINKNKRAKVINISSTCWKTLTLMLLGCHITTCGILSSTWVLA